MRINWTQVFHLHLGWERLLHLENWAQAPLGSFVSEHKLYSFKCHTVFLFLSSLIRIWYNELQILT